MARHGLGRVDGLVIHIADGIARADGGFAVAEDVPGEANVGGEILQVAMVEGTSDAMKRKAEAAT